MGYSNVAECDGLLANALTSSRPTSDTQKVKLINVGDVRDINRIPNDVVEYYISLADSQIDGILSQQYHVPLNKCAHGEWRLQADIDEYNPIVYVTTASNLVPGDEVVIRDDSSGIEDVPNVVKEVIDLYSFEMYNSPSYSFSASTSRVIRISFPPPINQISARYACSFIYDKYFAAQASPNVSDYGKELRGIAMQQLNDILNGKIVLRSPCARRIGDRFASPWLDSGYAVRSGPDGYAVQDRNMSKI